MVINSESWPKWVHKEQLKKHKKLEYCAEQRTTLVEAAHQFINGIPELDRYIVGCATAQLEELIKARNKKSTMCIDTMKSFGIDDDTLVDLWKWPGSMNNIELLMHHENPEKFWELINQIGDTEKTFDSSGMKASMDFYKQRYIDEQIATKDKSFALLNSIISDYFFWCRG